MSRILILPTIPEYYIVNETLVLAVDALIRRAYANTCYYQALQITVGYGLNKIPEARSLYDYLTSQYKANSGPINTVSFL